MVFYFTVPCYFAIVNINLGTLSFNLLTFGGDCDPVCENQLFNGLFLLYPFFFKLGWAHLFFGSSKSPMLRCVRGLGTLNAFRDP